MGIFTLQFNLWSRIIIPICSMYGIFTNMYPKNDPNVGKYSMHGASGIYNGNIIGKYWEYSGMYNQQHDLVGCVWKIGCSSQIRNLLEKFILNRWILRVPYFQTKLFLFLTHLFQQGEMPRTILFSHSLNVISTPPFNVTFCKHLFQGYPILFDAEINAKSLVFYDFIHWNLSFPIG